MKKYILIIFALTIIIGNAQTQSRFDSANYVRFYNQINTAWNLDSNIHVTDLTQEEKIEGLSKVWYEAKFNFANFDLVPKLNWDSAYKTFIPRCLATKNIVDYYNVLKEFNRLLRDGHSRVMEPPYYFFKNTFMPVVCDYIDGQVVVTQILKTDAPYNKIKAGWIIEKIDGVAVQDYIQKKISPYLHFSTPQDSIARIYRYELLRGPINSIMNIQFRDENNKVQIQKIKRTPWKGIENLVAFKVLDNNIGYLQINSFESDKVVKIFDSLFNTISKTDGLIIDIRGNGGGNSNVGYEIIGHLTDKPFKTSISVIRKYSPTSRAWTNEPFSIELSKWDWKPYKPNPYLKKVVLLIGASTYSAAEDFTVAFKSANRGLILGNTTGGSTGQPLGYNLPGGGIGFTCSKRDVQPNGEEFVGIGISPDKKIIPTLSGIRNGKDEVLQAALQLFPKQ